MFIFKITLSGTLSKHYRSFPSGLDIKNQPANTGDAGSIPGSGSPEGPLEEEMATHSSILAWEIPWTEELCGLQSMGSQRIRHD